MGQIFPTFNIDASEMHNEVKKSLELIIEEFEKNLLIENPTWESMNRFDELKDQLSRKLNEISHIKNVLNTPDIVEAYNNCIPMLTNFSAYISQNEDYFNYLNRIDKSLLNPLQIKILDKAIASFKKSGFGLPKEERDRLNEVSERLSILSQKFMSNISASKEAWVLNVKDEKELSGISPLDLERFKRKANSNNKDGYSLSLVTDYFCVLTDCDNREIRKEIYLGYNQTATKHRTSELDNSPVMNEILILRQEKAELVGFNNYAEFSLDNKMAESPSQVVDFLEDLSEKSRSAYELDIKEIKDFALSLGIDDYQLWDQSYVIKKYQEQKYSIDLSSVMEYFPLEKVLTGLFMFIDKMFGYQIKEIEAPHKYIEDLRLLELSHNGVATGYIYCDLISRDGKKSGAWMSDYIGKEYDSLPIAFVTCNFSASEPQLLKLNDVVTLFHEFGHALHHTLSKVEEPSAFGISGVAWDVVELPSTFMEFFVLDKSVLPNISGHYKTGECLPQSMVNSLKLIETNLASLTMLRQMEFSLVDMKAHMNVNKTMDELGDDFRAENGMSKLDKNICFYNQFAHIFSGGYSAGYYSYKWANILASDIFESFEDVGGVNSKLGKEYLEKILSKGSSNDMLDLFIDFKGRKPSPDAFLRHSGIIINKK